MLELLDVLPDAEAAALRWRNLPTGWTIGVVVDGSPVGPRAPTRRDERWEDARRRELRPLGVAGVVRRVSGGLATDVRVSRDGARRAITVELAWSQGLTGERSERLRASVEWWLQLCARDGWTVRVVVTQGPSPTRPV